MAQAQAVLSILTMLAYVVLGAVAVGTWIRYRDRSRGFLALALGLLAVLSLSAPLAAVAGTRLAPLVQAVVLVAFMGCCYSLLLFRHSLIPLDRRTMRAVTTVVVVVTTAAILGPIVARGRSNPVAIASVLLLTAAWCGCVLEPIYRLWRVSANLPAVQQARLRFLGAGYAAIVAVVVVAIGGALGGRGGAGRNPTLALVTQVIGLAVVPTLYASFAPPQWLRRAWRAREEEHFRGAIHDLLLFSPDRLTLAERALDWAVRLVGAEGGALIDADGGTLAQRRVTTEAVARALTSVQVRPEEHRRLRVRQERSGGTIVQPLALEDGHGWLVVVSGTFSPLFGGEEVDRLSQYSAAIAAALDRAKLVEALRGSEESIRLLNRDLEVRVEERTRELEASNQELEAFSYTVSHDLRAPLRAIDGFTRILVDEHADSFGGEARRYLDLVSQNAQDMGRLIDGLLTFSRLSRQAMNVTEVSIEDVANRAASRLLYGIEGRRLELSVAHLPPARSDPVLLETVFTNLLTNALKFTRDREVARIEVGFEEVKAPVPEVVYHVKDNGVGFDMKYADKLFGVFQRLHRSEDYEGTGAGLAIVQRVVARHGGRVWAQSEPGKGANFYFTLGGQQ